MEQTKVPASEWETCCATFSRGHRGWLITLATIATTQLEAAPELIESHWRTIAEKVRFEGLVLDAETGHYDILTRTRTGDAATDHRLNNVVSLIKLTVAGAHQGLRIDSEYGGKRESTLLRFRVSAKPEELDGIAEFEM